jgi:GNAT superfamily N-acetyltransferase
MAAAYGSAGQHGGVAARVRLAVPADDASVAALRRAWIEERAGAPIEDDSFEPAFAEWMERERRQRLTWLADVGGEPVGMLNMAVFTRMPLPLRKSERGPLGRWGYIANNFVLEPYRNRGIGTALLDAAVAHADAHDFARIVLTPSERSVPYYSRAGFVPATALLVRPGPGAPPG